MFILISAKWTILFAIPQIRATMVYFQASSAGTPYKFQHIPGNNTNSVHLLRSIRTWMAGLTLAPEGSGSLVKLH